MTRSRPSGPFPRQRRVRRVLGLAVVVLFAGLLLLVSPDRPQAQAAVGYSSEELTFVQLLNDYRASRGLPALWLSDSLSVAAERHASDMGKYAFFSHTTVRSDWFPAGSDPWDRMAACGYTYSAPGENIGAGQAMASQILATWKASSGHNANMLNAQAKVIGIGFVEVGGSPYRYYWVADFGAYVDPSAHPADGAPAPAPATTRYEQGDSRFGYLGPWTVISTGSASGSSYRRTDSAGASVTVSFDGTYLAWIAKTCPAYGKARVIVDGGAPETVDLYSATTKWQRKVWESGALKAGPHTVRIEWTGAKAPASTGTYITVDAFDVAGSLRQAPVPTRYQQNDSRFVYSGTWTAVSTSSASGGSFRYANKSGSSVTVTFTGTYLGWVAKKSPVYGRARVTVDGGAPVTVDLYSASTLWVQKVWSTGTLASGAHTVRIEWTGTKNSSATDYNISVDAFDIIGTPR